MEPFAAEKGKSNKGIQRWQERNTGTSDTRNNNHIDFMLPAVANVLASLRAKFHLGGVKKSRGE